MRLLIINIVAIVLACVLEATAQDRPVAFQNFSPVYASFETKADEEEATGMRMLERLIETRREGVAVMGYSRENRAIPLHFFPGNNKEKILIIAGVHGSEQAAIELARLLAKQLSGTNLKQDVLIVPTLFPDNAAQAIRHNYKVPHGRYSSEQAVDPNRQMPAIGHAFNATSAYDALNRPIEKENQLLLTLIQTYKPALIVNLHAISNTRFAGVYADPRTDCSGRALGFAADSALAVDMARSIAAAGGQVPGNRLDSVPTALYHKDPKIVAPGTLQPRNTEGAKLPGKRGQGVSLGTWATTAVCNAQWGSRAAVPLITVEFPGYKPSYAYANAAERATCLRNLQAYATALVQLLKPGNNSIAVAAAY